MSKLLDKEGIFEEFIKVFFTTFFSPFINGV